LKVAAGRCGGCGWTADLINLTAVEIESSLVCSLLILHDLQEPEKSENRSQSATWRHAVLSMAGETCAAPAYVQTFKR
jgi:hypothetical protein